MFSSFKQTILALYEAQQIRAAKIRANSIRQRNKRKPIPAYSQVQRLNGAIWESQFVSEKKGTM